MQPANQPKRPGAPLQTSNSPPPPRTKPYGLASIAVQSFAAFRSQTQPPPAPSPVRRKPLPPGSPVLERYSSAEFSNRSRGAGDTDNRQRSFSTNSPRSNGPRRLDPVLSPPLSDEELFVPRNLDDNPHGLTPVTSTIPIEPFVATTRLDRPNPSPQRTNLIASTPSHDPFTPRDNFVASSAPEPIFPERKGSITSTTPNHTFTPRKSSVISAAPNSVFPPRKSSLSSFQPVEPTSNNPSVLIVPTSEDSFYEPRFPSSKDPRSSFDPAVLPASDSQLSSQPTVPDSNESRPSVQPTVPSSYPTRSPAEPVVVLDKGKASSVVPTVSPAGKDKLSSSDPTLPSTEGSRPLSNPTAPSGKTGPTVPNPIVPIAASAPGSSTSTAVPDKNALGSSTPSAPIEDSIPAASTTGSVPAPSASTVPTRGGSDSPARTDKSVAPSEHSNPTDKGPDPAVSRGHGSTSNPPASTDKSSKPVVATGPGAPASSNPTNPPIVSNNKDSKPTNTQQKPLPSSGSPGLTTSVDDPKVSFHPGRPGTQTSDPIASSKAPVTSSESVIPTNTGPQPGHDRSASSSKPLQHSTADKAKKSSPEASKPSDRSSPERSHSTGKSQSQARPGADPKAGAIGRSEPSGPTAPADDPKVTFHLGQLPSAVENPRNSTDKSSGTPSLTTSVDDPKVSFHTGRLPHKAEDPKTPKKRSSDISRSAAPAEEPKAIFRTGQQRSVEEDARSLENQSFDTPRPVPQVDDPKVTFHTGQKPPPQQQHQSRLENPRTSKKSSLESTRPSTSVEEPKAIFRTGPQRSVEEDSKSVKNQPFDSSRPVPQVDDPKVTFHTGQQQQSGDPKIPGKSSFESSRPTTPVDDPKVTFQTGQQQQFRSEVPRNPKTSSFEPSRPSTPVHDPKVTFHIGQRPSKTEELKASVENLPNSSGSSGPRLDRSDSSFQPQQQSQAKGLNKSSDKKPTSEASTKVKHSRSASSFQPEQPPRERELKASANKAAHARSPTMPNMPLYASEPRPTNLKLRLDGVTEDFIDEDPYDDDDAPESAHETETKSKSPAGGKFTSFFGWNSSKPHNGAESPTTTFSEKSLSPAVSPRFPKPPSHMPAKMKPAGLEGLNIPVANSYGSSSYFNVPGTPLLSSSPQMNAHVEELERELREVSSELAASIRREMELEDEVERYKMESTTVMSDNRRTSDYYSDSGASSVRYPIGDSESKLEEVEMLRRKAEQERAQLKVRMAERTQEELRRRRDLEEQVQQLEEQVSVPRTYSVADAGRFRELENSLEDAKRRLAEERQVKENFEDLLTALREELEKHRNERDNLRDEVVPQLRARLEGLESEATGTQTLIYESTRMQQEIEQLRSENQTLVNARRMQQEIQQQQTRFQSIAEETEAAPAATKRVGLSRSNSLARSSNTFNRLSRSNSLARSNSVKDRTMPESPREGPLTGNPVKELEEQRDALHKALRHLLQRQELQQREFQKRIKELEVERDNALNLTPRRTTFHNEVAHLRDEVNSLRRRADDALEQKWQCEKGLGGLRMDLDRAQQETSSLRELLQEHDISVPEIRIDNQPLPLDKAYDELRTTHALSLARIKQMESDDTLGEAGAEAERTLDLLKRSISDAEAEREAAQQEAEQYRQQARELQKSEIEHLGKEQKLSNDLYVAATRMDDLSNRIQIQLKSNKSLRDRLTDAISRGEKEQEKSTEKIIELERRLKAAEDKVVLAQQSSEEAVSRHEDEVQTLKESHNNHLRRVKSGLLSPVAFSPKVPPSPVFAQRSPRLEITTSGPAMSIAEATRTELLEKRVEELEKALRDADHEMEEVVGRMNMAQMEVADLQYERDEAMRQTRKLQADIHAEREKVKALMAKT